MDFYTLGKQNSKEKEDRDIGKITEKELDEAKHLIVLNEKEFLQLEKKINLPEKTLLESTDSKKYPSVEFYDNLLFMTFNDLYWSEGGNKLISDELNLFLGRNNLMILYHGSYEKIRSLINRVDFSDLYKCLYSFIDSILDRDRKLISNVEDKALKIEDKILKKFHVKEVNEKNEYLTADYYMDQIVKLRKQLQFLKAYLEPLADVIEILEADESDLIPEDYDKYFTKLSLKADRTINQLTSLRDYIAQVRESWQAQVDLSFNKTMKFFTVVTTVFAPLTLLTGWYGMNFKYMPELNYQISYPMVFLVAVIISVVSIMWFKKNHYL